MTVLAERTQAGAAPARNVAGPEDDPWIVAKTVRSAVAVTALVLLLLASYGQGWAVIPVLCGALLGVSLLVVMDVAVRRVFTPERAREAAEKKGRRGGPKGVMLAFALIKYLLVGVLIWAVTHAWDLRAVMAFTGGYVLIHLIIGLRAMGRALFVRAA